MYSDSYQSDRHKYHPLTYQNSMTIEKQDSPHSDSEYDSDSDDDGER